jgi:hypothetical protein
MSQDILEAQSFGLPADNGFDPLSIPRQDLSYGAVGQAEVQPPVITNPVMTPAVPFPVVPAPVGPPTTSAQNPVTATPPVSETTVEDKPARNVHSRRRGIALGVLAALGIMFYNGDIPVPGSVPSLGAVQAATPAKPGAQTVARATTMLNSMIGQAEAIRTKTGTFRRISFPDGVQTMQSDSMLVLSVVVDGTCWYAAVVPGFDRIPRWDPTAMRCSLDRLKTHQTNVDQGR